MLQLAPKTTNKQPRTDWPFIQHDLPSYLSTFASTQMGAEGAMNGCCFPKVSTAFSLSVLIFKPSSSSTLQSLGPVCTQYSTSTSHPNFRGKKEKTNCCNSKLKTHPVSPGFSIKKPNPFLSCDSPFWPQVPSARGKLKHGWTKLNWKIHPRKLTAGGTQNDGPWKR